MPISVDLPDALVTRFPSLFRAFAQLAERVAALVDSPPASFAVAEVELTAATDALAVEGVGLVLRALDPTVEVVEVEGKRYRRLADAGRCRYFGLRGPVEVERHLYREIGVRNGPTIVPLDLKAGIVDGRWTPRAAAAAAHLLQDEPSRDAVETCRALGVMPYSRSSLERGGDAVGERWEEIRPVAESELAEAFVIPEAAVSVSASFDRVAVPMEEPAVDGAGQPLLDAEGKQRIRVAHRMAYCGVWTLHDAEGEALHSVRYARMPGEGNEQIEDALWADVHALTMARPSLAVVGLADGAPEMQHMLDRIVGMFGTSAAVALDFWHVVEKVAEAVRALKLPSADWIPRFKTFLRHDERGAEKILKQLRSWKAKLKDGEVPDALQEAITYLARNRRRMRYKRLRDKGLPIGSGHVEATCKALVSTRMKRSGARWKTTGGQNVLSLRGLAKSSRWSPAMDILLATYQADVREAA